MACARVFYSVHGGREGCVRVGYRRCAFSRLFLRDRPWEGRSGLYWLHAGFAQGGSPLPIVHCPSLLPTAVEREGGADRPMRGGDSSNSAASLALLRVVWHSIQVEEWHNAAVRVVF
jgi:hypothetical protein